ncbi:MAG: D-aminoacylase [Ectothiorhodospiraceae bacterium]|nr:D-aminoacylase [Chromatiales bacterium]MCP5154436.1 D-aminoacylase [Ectothiorhodospiraceae bacterium]
MTTPSGFDIVFRGATVIDGTGGPRRTADVAVRGDRVVAVGEVAPGDATRTVDARGLVLAPGFIDAHTHDDRAVLATPDMTPKVSQGVTSVIAGNCGVSLAPLAGREPVPPLNLLGSAEHWRFPTVGDYMARVRDEPPAVNVALLAGHSTLRVGAMDSLDRPATAAEIAVMVERLDDALAAGCIGLSTGLAYPPAIASPTSEVIRLAERVHAHGGIYTTHMRNEGTEIVASIEETLEVGRRAGVPVVISHHKCSGRPSWGKSVQTLAMIAEARRTQRVDLDVYPYTASSTVLIADWAKRAERVMVTWSEGRPDCAGRDLEEIRAEWGCSLEEACARLQPAGAIYHQMDEADLRRILAFDGAMVGSDGLPHDAFPHPRLWGTFPRVLGHYVREVGLMGLEEAVHRMSGRTAAVFGLADRGVLREGAFADLVLFDPDAIADRAEFRDPKQPAAGIQEVFVNGRSVWADGAPSGERPGRALRRAA